MGDSKDPMEQIEQFQVNREDFNEDEIIRYRNKCVAITFCTQVKDNKKCVIKTVELNLRSIIFFIREVEILGTQNHPALVPFIGYSTFKKGDRYKKGFIYLEKMEKGSLINYIKENKEAENNLRITETQKLIIAYGVSCAMEYLHHNNVIHRDIKPENVLLDSELHPYVTDFNASKFLDNLEKSRVSGTDPTISGTTPYIMSPEFFEDPGKWKDNFCIDYYAYGVTLFSLITCQLPSVDVNKVCNGIRFPFPENTPQKWKTLIEDCWNQEITKRPNFTQICDQLESDIFADPNKIDIEMFNDYKNIVYPLRPKKS